LRGIASVPVNKQQKFRVGHGFPKMWVEWSVKGAVALAEQNPEPL
jgi:hypothetical protein